MSGRFSRAKQSAGRVLSRAIQNVGRRHVSPRKAIIEAIESRVMLSGTIPTTVTLSGLQQGYCGSPMPASATAGVSGVTVDLTYMQNGQPVVNPTEAGSYAVTATVNDPTYYGSATGTLVIAPAQLTITANAVNKAYGNATTDTGTIGGIWLSDNITATFSSAGDSVTAAPGQYPITAVMGGSALANYTVVSNLSNVGTVTVTKANATVTLSGLAMGYCGSPMPATATPSVSGLEVDTTYTQNGVPVANPTEAGSYAMSSVINSPDYQGSATGTLVIAPAPLTITANPGSKAFGTTSTDTGTITGIWLSDNITATFSSTGDSASATPGQYPITAVMGGTALANYTVSSNLSDVGTLTVTKAAATVTLSGLAQGYCGSPMPATATPSVSGLEVDVAYTQNGTPVTNPTEAGSYDVTATINDPNYQGSATGTLVISPAPLTVVANNISKVFGQTATETGKITGIWLSDVITATYSSAGNAANAAPGAYPITAVVSGPKFAQDYVVVSNLNDVGTLTVTGGASVIANGQAITAQVGHALTATVATFSDSTPGASTSNLTATIAWGDGSTTNGSIVSLGSGQFKVQGTHTYSKTSSGLPVTVTIKPATGSSVTANGSANVNVATLVANQSASNKLNVGVSYNYIYLGSFADYNSLESNPAVYSASINWGDGSAASTGSFKRTGSTTGFASYWNVMGSHKYSKKGVFKATISIRETGSTQVLQLTATITVA